MITQRPYMARINPGGNFCGHVWKQPCLKIPTAFPMNLPAVIVKMTERFPTYYQKPRQTLPSLNGANGSQRQQRSERREACVLLFGSILLNLELSSMRCGIPTVDGFVPLSLKVLAKRAGLSYSRAERAMKDLKRAGLIAITQIAQMDDLGHFKGLPAIKKVNDIVFRLFGLGEMLKRAKKAAYKRLQQKAGNDQNPLSMTERLRVRLFISGIIHADENQKVGKHTLSHPLPSHGPPGKTQADVLIQLIQEHPDWSNRQVIDEAKRLTRHSF